MHELYSEILNCYELNPPSTFHYFSWKWHQVIFGLQLLNSSHLLFNTGKILAHFQSITNLYCLADVFSHIFFFKSFHGKNCLAHWFTGVGPLQTLPVSGILCASLRSHASILQWLLFTPGTTLEGLQTSYAPSLRLRALGSALAEPGQRCSADRSLSASCPNAPAQVESPTAALPVPSLGEGPAGLPAAPRCAGRGQGSASPRQDWEREARLHRLWCKSNARCHRCKAKTSSKHS